MLVGMADMQAIAGALSEHVPVTDPTPAVSRAAVAVVLREVGGAPEVLFIERARRKGDPWSGHMAFPGGRVEAVDAHPRQAAERETLEEVGLDLDGASYLGRLTDLRGRHAAAPDRGMVISAFVYHVEDPGPLQWNWEVEQAFWFPVAGLLESERHVSYPVRRRDRTAFPGIVVGDPERHIVWGLTYRFLEVFFEVLGMPLPDRWA
jgi:8-oxo-dGTP pyrophosphatase MutT (NUDIX family)